MLCSQFTTSHIGYMVFICVPERGVKNREWLLSIIRTEWRVNESPTRVGGFGADNMVIFSVFTGEKDILQYYDVSVLWWEVVSATLWGFFVFVFPEYWRLSTRLTLCDENIGHRRLLLEKSSKCFGQIERRNHFEHVMFYFRKETSVDLFLEGKKTETGHRPKKYQKNLFQLLCVVVVNFEGWKFYFQWIALKWIKIQKIFPRFDDVWRMEMKWLSAHGIF